MFTIDTSLSGLSFQSPEPVLDFVGIAAAREGISRADFIIRVLGRASPMMTRDNAVSRALRTNNEGAT
jgi:hypothetical protein